MFDGVTPDVEGRIVPTRFYRVCQNHFESMEDYRKLMIECAGGRAVHFTPLKPAEARWTDKAAALADVPSATFLFDDRQVSDVELAGQSGFSAEEKALLAINPRYRVEEKAGKFSATLRLAERAAAKLGMPTIGGLPTSVTIDRRKLDDPAYLESLYDSGVIVLLPKNFGSNITYLFSGQH